MIMDRTAFYGSRNMFDQHRDMMLDVDNMTYEVGTYFPSLLRFYFLILGILF